MTGEPLNWIKGSTRVECAKEEASSHQSTWSIKAVSGFSSLLYRLVFITITELVAKENRNDTSN